jgi:hypothetical protein
VSRSLRVPVPALTLLLVALVSIASPQTPEQKANSAASATALTGDGLVLQLAVPVEVSSSGVKVVGEGQIIRAPRPQPGSGPQLLVRLEGGTGPSRFQREYEVPDPRLAEPEGGRQHVMKTARTYLYVELSDRATSVAVIPKVEGQSENMIKMTEFSTREPSRIHLGGFAKTVCQGAYAESPLCQQQPRAQ